MSDLKTYLASKYMSGPKADAILARSTDSTVKKRRKKVKNEDYIGGSSSTSKAGSSAGLVLQDNDEWKVRGDDDDDLDGEDAPVIGKDVATFQRSSSQWATVASSSLPISTGAVGGPSSPPPNIKPDPDAPPAVVPPVQMTKRRGGLRTAAQLREEQEALAAARSPSPPPPSDENGNQPNPTETVHRDASGRVIDVAKLRDEARRAEEEERRKEAERKEWSKGLVQRQARAERAKEEKEMSKQDVGRTRDDVRMNNEMKEVERWNDPAAGFLTQKKKSKGPRKPRYQGSWQPNRFGIAPGYRWDGVDRSTGFEKKYFQAQNSASRRQYEQNQWSVEDM